MVRRKEKEKKEGMGGEGKEREKGIDGRKEPMEEVEEE